MRFPPIAVLTAFLAVALLAAGWQIRRTRHLRPFGKTETLPLRGLLALLVVLGHLDTRTHHYSALLSNIHWATPAVAVFFFLSGYGLWKAHEAALSSGDALAYWRPFPVRSAVKLLTPVLILGLGLQLSVWLGGDTVREAFASVTSGSLLGIPHAWYVKTLLFFYLVTCFCYRCIPRRALFCIGAVVLAYWLVMRILHSREFYWWMTCMAFPAGWAFSMKEARVRALVVARPLLVSGLSALALVLAYALYRLNDCLPICRVREPFYVLLGPTVALCIMVFGVLERIAPLRFLGIISYEIYLIHGIFEYGFLDRGWHPAAYIAAVLAATVGLAVPLHWLDMKVMGRLRGRKGST